jgi:hypothetical protein
MEKLPNLDVIGNASEEEKWKFVKRRTHIFTNQLESEGLSPEKKRSVEEANFPKSPEQISILNFINEETNKLMVELGIEPFDVPPENFYILPDTNLKELTDSKTGAYEDESQAVGLTYHLRSSLFRFAYVSYHEMLHFKARQVSEVYKNENKVKNQTYRHGVRAYSTSKKDAEGNWHAHFVGLDEAIVGRQEKLFLSCLLDLPELAEEKVRQNTEEYKLARRKIAEEEKLPEDEINWIDPLDNKKWNGCGYYYLRRVLEYVCEEIAKEFSDMYEDKEAVFREFLKANFNGNLLTIGRLIEKTFGEGSFRDLGDIKTEGGQTANLILEKLGKMRRKILSERNKN